MPATPEFLFVYGTLHPKHAGRLFTRLPTPAGPGIPARVRGHLYDLGAFPAAVPDAAAGAWVDGVVVPVPDADTLAALDAYEGFEPRNRERSLFVREICTARLSGGRSARCWIYAYRRPLGDAQRISQGRYDTPHGDGAG